MHGPCHQEHDADRRQGSLLPDFLTRTKRNAHDGRVTGTTSGITRGRPRLLCFLHAVELGGVELTATRLCRALSPHYDVTLLLGRADGWRGGPQGVRVLHAPAIGRLAAWCETIWMMLVLPFIIVCERPDVIFCAGNTYTSPAAVLRVLLGAYCPPIVAKISNSHDRRDLPRPVRQLYGMWCRLQAVLFDHFLALRPAMAAEACDVMRLPPARITVVPNAMFDRTWLHDLSAIERGQPTSGRRFLAIGRLTRQKNFGLLIRAFARGARGDDRLVILGDGEERGRLRKLIDRHGLSERVSLPGHRADVPTWLAQSDVLVLSSDYEGVPGVVIEAFAAGLPVIATDCCASMADLLGGGARGALVPVGDECAFATTLATFDPAGYDAVAARRFAAGFTIEHAAGACAAVFDRVMAVPSPRRSVRIQEAFA